MIKRLWQLGRAQRWKMILQLVGQWMSNLLIVSVVTVGVQLELTQQVAVGWWWLIGGQLTVAVLYWIFGRRLSRNGWAVAASQELQDQFLNAYLKHEQGDEANVMRIVQQDLGTLKRVTIFFDTIIPTILELALTGLLLVGVGFAIWPLSLLIPLAGILLLGMGMGMLQGMGNRKNLAYIDSFNRMGQRFLDDFKGMSTLIMGQRQQRYAADFKQDTENFRQKTMGVLEYQLQSLTIMDFCLYGAIGFFLLAQSRAVAAGTVTLTAAVGLSTLTAVWLIDFRKFGYFMHVFMATLPKLKRLFAMIDDAQTPTTVAQSADLPTIKTVTLNGAVGYQHPLVTTTLTLRAGQLVGITGPSGSGKSTLAQTLMQQIPLLKGNIELNGQRELTTVAPLDWLKHAVYLGPTPRLFDETIQANLLLGPHPDDWQAQLARTRLCQFVHQLPAGYATPVGENGVQLSPGQRQQVAVARAILADKDVYIFDEVTSNIDPENADQIMAVIHQLAKTKVVLLITHRLADLQQLPTIKLVAGGQLVSGNLAELQATVPAFAELVAAQRQLLKEAGMPCHY